MVGTELPHDAPKEGSASRKNSPVRHQRQAAGVAATAMAQAPLHAWARDTAAEPDFGPMTKQRAQFGKVLPPAKQSAVQQRRQLVAQGGEADAASAPSRQARDVAVMVS